MIIDIRNTPSGHSCTSQEVTLDDQQAQEAGCAGVIHCSAEIYRVASQIDVRVRYSCDCALDCSRCLKSYKEPLKSSFEVILRQQVSERASAESDNEMEFFFTEEDQLVDIRQALYDDIMINIPLMPLCNQQCPGIERDRVAREESRIDPRWEALKKLKNKE